LDKVNEEWGFHGASRDSISSIAKEGFRHPDELNKMDDKKKKNKKKKKKNEGKS